MQNLDLLQNDKTILLLTAKQLIVDFEACSISLKFSNETPDYPALFSQTIAVIEELMKLNPEKLFQLFYRIDLPEHLVKEILRKEKSTTQLAELVIKRVLQKVILKKQYSK